MDDRADMESAPTLVNMVWHNDKFMQLNIVAVLIVFCNFDLPLFPIAARPKLGYGQSPHELFKHKQQKSRWKSAALTRFHRRFCFNEIRPYD